MSSAGRGPALTRGFCGQRWGERARCGQPRHPAFSKTSPRGVFGSEGREHYASGGEGVQERRPLSDPPHTHSKPNEPMAKAQSRSSASPPRALPPSQSCQDPTREPNPEKRSLTLAGELGGKFLLLVMAKKKKKEEEIENHTFEMNLFFRASKERDGTRQRTEPRSILQGWNH